MLGPLLFNIFTNDIRLPSLCFRNFLWWWSLHFYGNCGHRTVQNISRRFRFGFRMFHWKSSTFSINKYKFGKLTLLQHDYVIGIDILWYWRISPLCCAIMHVIYFHNFERFSYKLKTLYLKEQVEIVIPEHFSLAVSETNFLLRAYWVCINVWHIVSLFQEHSTLEACIIRRLLESVTWIRKSWITPITAFRFPAVFIVTSFTCLLTTI